MSSQNDHAVNSASTPIPETPSTTPVVTEGPYRKLVRFLREVTVELKKTNWPSRNELTKYTVFVMVTIFIVALFLFAGDKAMAFIVEKLLNTTAG